MLLLHRKYYFCTFPEKIELVCKDLPGQAFMIGVVCMILDNVMVIYYAEYTFSQHY